MRYVQILLWGSILALSGCITDQPNEIHMFGEAYNLLQTDSFPKVSGDTLNVRVAYSGCSGNHLFALRFSLIANSVTEVWLFKEARSQPCDAYFEEDKTFLLPKQVRTQQSIVLLGPNGKRFTVHR